MAFRTLVTINVYLRSVNPLILMKPGSGCASIDPVAPEALYREMAVTSALLSRRQKLDGQRRGGGQRGEGFIQ